MNSQFLTEKTKPFRYPESLRNCCFCPRNCHADRVNGKPGYCKSDAGLHIASVCVHKGEEPVISGNNGICNVFFNRCNIQCVYCQNWQISRNSGDIAGEDYDIPTVAAVIAEILNGGIDAVGFVSPSHYIPQIIAIMKYLENKGIRPIYIYNSNGYDKVSSLRMLEGIIDVYLPDFKYRDDSLALALSDAPDYSHFAGEAIREMYRQKGSTLLTNSNNYAMSGLIIRHLVLPGYIENSLSVLQFIAENISVNVHISLMSQYFPNDFVRSHPILKRQITFSEYNRVVKEMEKLGFTKGWIQEPCSAGFYQPDFNHDHPFEKI